MGRLLTRLGGSGANATPGRRKNTIVIIGHSFIANCGTADATWGTASASPSSTGATWSKGIFERAMILLGQPLTILSQQGITGQTSAQILARFSSALMLNPGWIYLDCISNDSQGSIATSVTIANINQMLQQAKDAGIMVILALDPARSGYTQAQVAAMATVNRYYRNYGMLNPGVLIFDQAPYFYSTGTFANSYSTPETTRMLNESGNYIHPNAKGAGFAAAGLASLLRPYLSPSQSHMGTVNNDGATNGDLTNLIKNPIMYGVGGVAGTGITGSVASFGYAQRAGGSTIVATASVVTRASLSALLSGFFDDGSLARVQKLAISASAALTDSIQYYNYLATAPTGGSGPYIAEVDVAVTCSGGTIETIQGHLFVGSTPAWTAELNLNIDSGDTLGLTTFSGKLRSHTFYMPSGTIAVAGNETGLGVFFNTSVGGTCDAYIANPTIRAL